MSLNGGFKLLLNMRRWIAAVFPILPLLVGRKSEMVSDLQRNLLAAKPINGPKQTAGSTFESRE
jgi:hypothetical protein